MTKILKKRHLAKAISYRIIGTLATFIIGWTTTGNIQIGLSIGLFDVLFKTFLYYVHERAWYKFNKYGVVKDEEKE